MLSRLSPVHRSLVGLQRIDGSIARFQELYDTAHYALEELARESDTYAQAVDLDPERLAEVQRRRDIIFRLLKKHGPALEDVIETGRRSRAELDLVDSAGFDLRQLEGRERAASEQLAEAAAALTAAREAAAARLSHAVDQIMPELGLVDSHFGVALSGGLRDPVRRARKTSSFASFSTSATIRVRSRASHRAASSHGSCWP